jgi:hypothetical protein
VKCFWKRGYFERKKERMKFDNTEEDLREIDCEDVNRVQLPLDCFGIIDGGFSVCHYLLRNAVTV